MDKSIRGLLGLLDDSKRIYQFQREEVEREEFECCVIFFNLVFGEKGYIETIGPTWNMVHDPRFSKIEACFIHNRQAVFGGDARQGLQTISETGVLGSSVENLEQYSEIIGEGRHFAEVLQRRGVDPITFKDASANDVWAFIRSECPNYWDRKDNPNQAAKRMFNLIRADLLGLVWSYAQEALVQEWNNLETGELCTTEDMANEEVPKVWMEVEQLEKALTLRATLRSTAARILKMIGLTKLIEDGNFRLTDQEVDKLLAVVYKSEWPDGRLDLVRRVSAFLFATKAKPYEERLAEQTRLALEDSQRVVTGLRDGTIKPINRETDPPTNTPMTAEEQMMEGVLADPIKHSIFLQYVAAEKAGLTDVAEKLRRYIDPTVELSDDEAHELLEVVKKELGVVAPSRSLDERAGAYSERLTAEEVAWLAEVVPEPWRDEFKKAYATGQPPLAHVPTEALSGPEFLEYQKRYREINAKRVGLAEQVDRAVRQARLAAQPLTKLLKPKEPQPLERCPECGIPGHDPGACRDFSPSPLNIAP